MISDGQGAFKLFNKDHCIHIQIRELALDFIQRVGQRLALQSGFK